jgi:hypothetical protein
MQKCSIRLFANALAPEEYAKTLGTHQMAHCYPIWGTAPYAPPRYFFA